MPSRRIATSVPANGQIVNQLAGEDIEFPGRISEVEVAATAAAVGTQMDVQYGSDLVLSQGVIPVEAAAGQGPLLPDNLLSSDVAAAADRIVIRLVNTTGAPVIVTTFVRVNPL